MPSADSAKPSFLLLGSTGQVGSALQRALPPLLQKHQATLVTPTRAQLDLTHTGQVNAFLQNLQPTCILNAAAYTQVDAAEDNIDEARLLNVDLPACLGAYSAEYNIPFVHYSTDYVFDGTKAEPYIEEDIPNPLNVYGKTKHAGEKALLKTHAPAWIFRTSWVYSPYGKNFVHTIKKLAQQRTSLDIIDDQTGAPTSAQLIADITLHVLTHYFENPSRCPQGLYHLTSQGHTSWHAWAKLIVTEAQQRDSSVCAPQNINPIKTQDYTHAKALRPLNSCLDTHKLMRDFNITLPLWRGDFNALLPSFFTSIIPKEKPAYAV